jgi:hypothetical protein
MMERSILLFKKLSFGRVLCLVLLASFVAGFAVFVLSGATTDKGTTGAIRSENALIMSAEKTRCIRYGTYASISTLRKEGLLTSNPLYNSVVYLPGKNCGTVIVGSPAYQLPAG